MKNIYKAIIILTLITVVAITVLFVKKIDPYISAENKANGVDGKRNICVVATQISPNNWGQFLKTRLFGYDVLEKQLMDLEKEVQILKERLKAQNKI